MTKDGNHIDVEQGRPSTDVQLMETVVKLRRMIQSYAFMIVRDFHLTEDIFQEVALVVMTQKNRLPPPDKISPWVREVTRRKSLELLRKHRRMPNTLSEDTLELLSQEFTEDENQDDAEFREWKLKTTAKCVNRLNGMSKRVVQMRYGGEQGASCGDIAQMIGRSVKAVYNLLVRAREALMVCIENEQSRYWAQMEP